MKDTVWNAKQLKYGEGLSYDDFVVRREDPVIVRASSPVNAGAEPTWSYRNMLTKDVGSDIYLAHISFPAGGGHDYHAHSGWEAIYMLKGKLQSTYRSIDGKDVQTILEPGDVIYAPQGTPHSVWNAEEEGCEFLVIKFPPYFLEDIPLPAELQQTSFEPNQGGE